MQKNFAANAIKITTLSSFFILAIFFSYRIAVSAAGEGLSKSVSNATSGSTSQASAGDVLNWVVGINNGDGSNGTLSIEDAINPMHSYLPGSLVAPQGWTKTYSPDGTNFNAVPEPANVLGVGAYNSRVGSPATSNTGTNSLPPGSSVLQATGGDGYYPVAYRTSTGKDLLFNIFHYTRSNATSGIGGKTVTKSLGCTDVATGDSCDLDGDSVSEFPKYLSDVDGSDGSDIAEANLDSNEMLDIEIVNGRMFFPAQRGTADAGIGCFDVEAGKFCGYYPLISSPTVYTNSLSDITEIEGVKAVGSKVYAYSPRARQLVCLDASSLTSCGTTSLSGSLAAWSSSSSDNNAYVTLDVADGKVFITQYNYMNNPNTNIQIACYDTSSSALCSGWGTAGVVSVANTSYPLYVLGVYGEGRHSYSFMFNDSSGNEEAICLLAHVNSTTGSLKCYKISDGSAYTSTAVTALETALNNTVPWNTGLFTVTKMLQAGFFYRDNKVYIPLDIGAGHQGATYCFDFTTEQGCSGFGTNGYKAWGQISGSEVGGYGYAEINGCMFGLGDTSILWSFNPENGTTPCDRASISIEVDSPATSFYCDAKPHTVAWDKVSVDGIDTNVTSLIVEIYDADDTDTNAPPILTSGNILPSNEFSIASLPYGTGTGEYDNLRALVYTDVNNVGSVTVGQYNATLSFIGDNPQICYSTVVSNDASFCNKDIVNQAVIKELQGVSAEASIGVVCSSGTPNSGGNQAINSGKITSSESNQKPSQLASTGDNMYRIIFASVVLALLGFVALYHSFRKSKIIKL